VGWPRRSAAGPALVDLGAPVGKSQTVAGKADTGVPIGGFSILEVDSAKKVTDLLEPGI